MDKIINDKRFNEKYSKLQEQWLVGHRNSVNIDNDEKSLYGSDNLYILPYIDDKLGDSDKNITFHPSYSYSYTDYDKEYILPSLDLNNLLMTENRFKDHIDRLETKILQKLAEKENKLLNETDEEKKKRLFTETEKEKKNLGWIVPPYCIPIRADIRKFDWNKLALKQKLLSGRLFDAIMMDPPWQLASANPTRGVALGYSQLNDDIISSLPIPSLQINGLIFIWVINAKYRLALQLFKKWGYKMIADIAWVKQTVNRRIANGHGFYLQHAKETCLIGLKGELNKIPSIKLKGCGISSNIIYSERRGQSQKPEEIYQYIEHLIPKGYYMEIFGRRNNLRNGWLTIGNEL